jgi:hypothetical protein
VIVDPLFVFLEPVLVHIAYFAAVRHYPDITFHHLADEFQGFVIELDLFDPQLGCPQCTRNK